MCVCVCVCCGSVSHVRLQWLGESFSRSDYFQRPTTLISERHWGVDIRGLFVMCSDGTRHWGHGAWRDSGLGTQCVMRFGIGVTGRDQIRDWGWGTGRDGTRDWLANGHVSLVITCDHETHISSRYLPPPEASIVAKVMDRSGRLLASARFNTRLQFTTSTTSTTQIQEQTILLDPVDTQMKADVELVSLNFQFEKMILFSFEFVH